MSNSKNKLLWNKDLVIVIHAKTKVCATGAIGEVITNLTTPEKKSAQDNMEHTNCK